MVDDRRRRRCSRRRAAAAVVVDLLGGVVRLVAVLRPELAALSSSRERRRSTSGRTTVVTQGRSSGGGVVVRSLVCSATVVAVATQDDAVAGDEGAVGPAGVRAVLVVEAGLDDVQVVERHVEVAVVVLVVVDAVQRQQALVHVGPRVLKVGPEELQDLARRRLRVHVADVEAEGRARVVRGRGRALDVAALAAVEAVHDGGRRDPQRRDLRVAVQHLRRRQQPVVRVQEQAVVVV
mmetsp:Transcript_27870/g.85508  ORF Transcript_27870/g.85508 Transcript_27870/m.85508 type:complete len:236 (-) Transcript_27870:1183-1890(-)